MKGRDKARLTRAIATIGALSLLALTACSRQHIPQDTFHAAGPEGSVARMLDLPGEREQIRVRATVTALHLLRALLMGSRDEFA